MVGQGFSHYEMHIRINRFNVNQTQNSKISVIFPQDTEIWTGPSSAFVFDTSINEVSNIVSETKTEEKPKAKKAASKKETSKGKPAVQKATKQAPKATPKRTSSKKG